MRWILLNIILLFYHNLTKKNRFFTPQNTQRENVDVFEEIEIMEEFLSRKK
jgi:hypothetical protein